MERFAENPELVGQLRESFWKSGLMVSKVVAGQEEAGNKFADYFDTQEKLKDLPSHRILALFRGRKEGFLTINIEMDEELPKPGTPSLMEYKIARHFAIDNKGRAADKWLQEVVKWTWKIKVKTSLDMDLKNVYEKKQMNPLLMSLVIISMIYY